MSLHYQYAIGNISKGEYKELTGIDVDVPTEIIQYRELDENDKPISGIWFTGARSFLESMVGKFET